MLLEPDRFRHTPPIAPERSHGPQRPTTANDPKRSRDVPQGDERSAKPPIDKH